MEPKFTTIEFENDNGNGINALITASAKMSSHLTSRKILTMGDRRAGTDY